MKLLTPTISAWKTCRDSAVLTDRQPRPVDATGGTPRLWADCVGWQVDEPAATVADQDLVQAVHAGEQSGRLRPQDKGSRAKLAARLAAEIAKARTDRESGKPPGRQR